MYTVFIHGEAGTTGLRLKNRLSERGDLVLKHLPEADRKNPDAAAALMNECDVVFFCLPDDASREAALRVENPHTIVLDTSTAHRTSPDWAYGFPELSPAQSEKVQNARRIAVPGCHASGFIALVAPLVADGLLPPGALLSCFSLTGYSGGGKKMIAEYESEGRGTLLDAPRQYGLTQSHKHLPEMKMMAGVANAPVFCPVVSDFYSGMEVTVPVFSRQLAPGAKRADVIASLRSAYSGPVVRFAEGLQENGFASANAYSGRDCMEISVSGSDERLLLIARYDNLGKGASGAAIQCMNLALGIEPTCGLVL